MPVLKEEPADSSALLALLRETRSLLACHLALGLSSYPAAPELRRFAAARPAASPRPIAEQTRPAPAEHCGDVAAATQESGLSVQGLADQLAGCRRCAAPAAAVPGTGSAEPKLVVVGDCFLGAEPEKGLLWGRNEDELFWRMMAAIQLDRQSVFVTNLVKCPQHALLKAGSEAGRSCLFWLEQELRLLRPSLICAMGETAAQAVLGRNTPLLRLRGTFHSCQVPAASQAQVLATYHPRFLLQHQDMKAAAWQDLQMLQRRLLRP